MLSGQPVITTRIYVLHKITIALKFVLHKFWFANSREETANPRLATMYKVGDWKRVGIASKQCDEREQFKSNQEHIATHIFINLVTHVDFLQLQGYTSM